MMASRNVRLKVDVAELIAEKTGCSRAWLEHDAGEAFPKTAGHHAAEEVQKYGAAQMMEIIFEVPVDIHPGQKIMGVVRLKTDNP